MTEFPRVGVFSKGYDCAQVDAFFEDARRAYEGGVPPEQFSSEQVRLATFELKSRGYDIEAVDGAMNRLEAAFVNGERFSHPTSGRGYACDEVDDLLDRIAAYFDEAGELTAEEIRTATFRPKRGKKAYAEGPVDAYLGRAVEILLAVD